MPAPFLCPDSSAGRALKRRSSFFAQSPAMDGPLENGYHFEWRGRWFESNSGRLRERGLEARPQSSKLMMRVRLPPLARTTSFRGSGTSAANRRMRVRLPPRSLLRVGAATCSFRSSSGQDARPSTSRQGFDSPTEHWSSPNPPGFRPLRELRPRRNRSGAATAAAHRGGTGPSYGLGSEVRVFPQRLGNTPIGR